MISGATSSKLPRGWSASSERISNSTAPSAYTSARASISPPATCSGLMVPSEPTTVPTPVCSGDAASIAESESDAVSGASCASLATPQSSRYTSP